MFMKSDIQLNPNLMKTVEQFGISLAWQKEVKEVNMTMTEEEGG